MTATTPPAPDRPPLPVRRPGATQRTPRAITRRPRPSGR